ncbi:MAG: hypothetical protein AAF721_23720, partial [Myxococcota bacterium]
SRARLRSYLAKAVLDARREIAGGDDPRDPALAAHGKLSPRDRARVLRNAVDTVVGPCVTALLESLPSAA